MTVTPSVRELHLVGLMYVSKLDAVEIHAKIPIQVRRQIWIPHSRHSTKTFGVPLPGFLPTFPGLSAAMAAALRAAIEWAHERRAAATTTTLVPPVVSPCTFLALEPIRRSDNVQGGHGGALIVVDGPRGWYEYEFDVAGLAGHHGEGAGDETTASSASVFVSIEYASGEARPVRLSLNGEPVGEACGDATGGWDASPASLRVVYCGPFAVLGSGGTNVLRVSTDGGYFPHLKSVSVGRGRGCCHNLPDTT